MVGTPLAILYYPSPVWYFVITEVLQGFTYNKNTDVLGQVKIAVDFI